jgi:hypothetical protein
LPYQDRTGPLKVIREKYGRRSGRFRLFGLPLSHKCAKKHCDRSVGPRLLEVPQTTDL